jgi:FeS assembly SUF system protein
MAMSEDATNTARGPDAAAPAPHPVPLTVLPSSGRVDELKRELQESPPGQTPTAQTPAPAQASAAANKEGETATETPRQRDIQRKVEGVLRTIYDPEIPVNIYDLGLIYEVKVDETDAVRVKMTLTAPACPVAGTLPGEVEAKIEQIPEVRTADVELVWEPPWSKDRMSESAMLDLGFM